MNEVEGSYNEKGIKPASRILDPKVLNVPQNTTKMPEANNKQQTLNFKP